MSYTEIMSFVFKKCVVQYLLSKTIEQVPVWSYKCRGKSALYLIMDDNTKTY